MLKPTVVYQYFTKGGSSGQENKDYISKAQKVNLLILKRLLTMTQWQCLWSLNQANKTFCELCTSQCSQECYFHNECHWSRAGRCRCSCWHSQCSWLRSYRGCSHTRWCPPRTSFHESRPGRCTGSRSPRHYRALRCYRGLQVEALDSTFFMFLSCCLCAFWSIYTKRKQIKGEGTYWACSRQCCFRSCVQ